MMVKYQIKTLLLSKVTIIVWILLLGTAVVNFVLNCIHNAKIHYVTEMYDPVKTLVLSGWSDTGIIFMYIYPLIVVLPTAMIYYNERQNGINSFIQSRCGFRKYYYGNAIAVFIVTFVLFTLPFLMELCLSEICFSKYSIGDPSGLPYYESLAETGKILLYKLYIFSPGLYSLVMIIRFGVISGIFSLFNYSFSTSPKIRYKMISMIPLLVLLYALMLVDGFSPVKLTYIQVLPMFEYTKHNEYVYVFGYLLILLVSILVLMINEKRYYSYKK